MQSEWTARHTFAKMILGLNKLIENIDQLGISSNAELIVSTDGEGNEA